MADITPAQANREMAEIRNSHEAQKEELQEKFQDEINTTRERYKRKADEADKSGQAAVSHIQKSVKERVRAAEQEATERGRALDEQIRADLESLKKKENLQEGYIENAKQHYAEWAKAQSAQLRDQTERMNER